MTNKNGQSRRYGVDENNVRMKQVLYFFMHIPKTAGTSFRQMLCANFAQNEILPDDQERNAGRYTISKPEFTLKYADQFPRTKLITTHYPFSHLDDLFPDRKIIRFTFFREPLDRAVSHLLYFKKIKANEFNPNDFHEVIDAYHYQFNNFQYAFLTDNAMDLSLEEGQRLCVSRIKEIDHIGFQDQFSASIERFNKTGELHFGDPLSLNVNTNKVKGLREIPEDVIERLRSMQERDYKLWSYLNQLRKSGYFNA